MKILHILNSDGFSGAENVVCQIIDMFRSDNNIEMAYCSPDGPISETLSERKIHFVPLKKLKMTELMRVIKTEKPDLIHAHDFRASILSVFASREIPVISHLHNNLPEMKKRGKKSILYVFTCRYYKRILTVSPSVFDEFVYGQRYRNKLMIIGNPVNVRAIRSRGGNMCQTEKKYDLGFCGRFSPQKNPEGFVNIVKELAVSFPDITAVMIGDGGQKDGIMDLIKEKKLDENIKILGFQKEPYPIMRACKILCMPSRWEGFGLAAVEALALGTPVVCSNVGGLPEIVREECGKVCNSEDEMVKACFDLLTNEKDLEYRSERAVERALELDNIAEYKENLSAIYTHILK